MPASGGWPVTTFHTVWYTQPATRYQPGRSSACARPSTSVSVWFCRSATWRCCSWASRGSLPGFMPQVYQRRPRRLRQTERVATGIAELIERFYAELWNSWDDSAVDRTLSPGFVFRGSLGQQTNGRDGWRQ